MFWSYTDFFFVFCQKKSRAVKNIAVSDPEIDTTYYGNKLCCEH